MLQAARPSARSISLIVDGEPKGKGRPKFNSVTKQAYTPTLTKRAEDRVALAWMGAGRPMLEDGAIGCQITIVLARAQNHWRKDGTLTPEGQRHMVPRKKPDLDNVAKLVLDALNGLAFRDDVDVVHMQVDKVFALYGQQPHVQVRLWTFG
jgi:Holliday junction resolvase RusA-like endonuclease